MLLTGAGLSTRSGIPDYRSPGRERRRPPIQHRAFINDVLIRRRYWARSAVGWPQFREAQPNAGHAAVAALQRAGVVSGVVTQNVDGLHAKAGSHAIELHGALAQVRCLDCGALDGRDAVQERILEANPTALEWSHSLSPDGDADIPDDAVADFIVPLCVVCRGVLKPDVVFFGDSVPAERTARALSTLDRADALLVLGSSLEVFSGYRFALRAAERRMPIVLITWVPPAPTASPQLGGRSISARHCRRWLIR